VLAPLAVRVVELPIQTEDEGEAVMATTGPALTVIFIWSEEGLQGLFDMVHSSTTVPAPRPVIVDVGEAGVVMVAVPETRVHNPVPTVGVLPARVTVELVQAVWSAPALAVVGLSLLVIITSSKEGVHEPLLMVQRSVLAPTPIAVTPDVGEAGVVIVAVPDITVHAPVPTVGVFPARVVVVEQIF